MDTSVNDKHFFTIFVFPFMYYRLRDGEKLSMRPSDLANQLCRLGEDSDWEEKAFDVSNALEYNEWHYFYPYVRSMLYSTNRENQVSDRDTRRRNVDDSERKKSDDGIRYLRRKDYNKENNAELLAQFYASDGTIHSVKTTVNSVDLHLFDNQIGLLSISTEKKTSEESVQSTFEDYLRYNETVRRVYPPFLDRYSPSNVGNTSVVKSVAKMLPHCVALLSPKKPPVEERFPDLRLPEHKMYLSRVIRELLSPIRFNDGTFEQADFSYDLFTDDRMFIVSYYRDQELATSLSAPCCGEYMYEKSDEWYSMIFVEGDYKDPTIKNERTKRELIRTHTYDRWVEGGSFYGMSRYSLVFLGKNDWHVQNLLYDHMKSMYYQMALIVLFQRAMLVKFSEEIKELTKYFKGGGRLDPELRKKADQLHGDFIKFTNEYWYTEVTPQEQGIEMYRQWMNLLGHDYLYAKVKGEIAELAAHVRTMIEHESNQNIELITKMGLPLSVIIAVMTVWLAIYGEGHVPDLLSCIVHLRFDAWKVILFAFFAISGVTFLFQLGKFIYRYVVQWFRKSPG